MDDFTVDWPVDIDTHDWKTKGWIGLPVKCGGRQYCVTFFDPVRLQQEIEAAVAQRSYFAELNLVVIASVERTIIEAALQAIATRGDFGLFRPDDFGEGYD